MSGSEGRQKRLRESVLGEKEVWQCIRDLQRGKRGRMVVRVVTVDDEDGKPCVTTTEQQAKWRRHFSKSAQCSEPK